MFTSPNKNCILCVNVFVDPPGLLPAFIASLNTRKTSVTVATSSNQSEANSLSTDMLTVYSILFSSPVTIACELASK